MNDSALALACLLRRLERLEPRRSSAVTDLVPLGHGAVDRALGGGLARGRLHEVVAEMADGGSASGFAALLGLKLGGGAPLLWLRSEAVQRQAGRLHAMGLRELGLDPARVLLGLVPDDAALLRAAAEAAQCASLGALVIECLGSMRRFDLTASRRLMLAAEISGVAVLVLRILGEIRCEPNAADTRWRVAAASSVALEADAPGAPMFELELLRRRSGFPAGPWRVEWNRDRSCFAQPDDTETRAKTSLSRFVLPLASGRAAEALRWAG